MITVVLMYRIYTDDKRCMKKYKNGWELYKEYVPYSLIKNIY